jgi:hypothetical protein
MCHQRGEHGAELRVAGRLPELPGTLEVVLQVRDVGCCRMLVMTGVKNRRNRIVAGERVANSVNSVVLETAIRRQREWLPR